MSRSKLQNYCADNEVANAVGTVLAYPAVLETGSDLGPGDVPFLFTLSGFTTFAFATRLGCGVEYSCFTQTKPTDRRAVPLPKRGI